MSKFMTAMADEEDALEKLPLTLGPVVPAPGRRGALQGAAEAKRRLADL